MSKTAEKTHTSTWHPTKAPVKSDSIIQARPFVMPEKKKLQVQGKEGYRVPQSVDITDNISRWDSVRARSSENEGTTTPPSESKARKGLGLKAPPPPRPTLGMNIQPKLTIGEPGDKYEQEADRVAAHVVKRINEPASVQGQGLVASPLSAPSISRVSGGLVAPRMETLQRRQGNGGGLIASNLETSINRIRGGGQPLDVGLRESIGQAMGADLSGVRVHTDAQSDRLNRSIQAKAFTTGKDVFFSQGEYQPRTPGGQELIAHELTHVVQQTEGEQKPRTKIAERVDGRYYGHTGARVEMGYSQQMGGIAEQRKKGDVTQRPTVGRTYLQRAIRVKGKERYLYADKDTVLAELLQDWLKMESNMKGRILAGRGELDVSSLLERAEPLINLWQQDYYIHWYRELLSSVFGVRPSAPQPTTPPPMAPSAPPPGPPSGFRVGRI